MTPPAATNGSLPANDCRNKLPRQLPRTKRYIPVLPTDHAWAVVDVETSGFDPANCRVLSVAALTLDPAGRPEQRFHTLVDAGVDPGPVHVHGLTREKLAGAPRFEQVAPDLLGLLEGRVLVAHNAAFDHRFLAAEADRAGMKLPVERGRAPCRTRSAWPNTRSEMRRSARLPSRSVMRMRASRITQANSTDSSTPPNSTYSVGIDWAGTTRS